MNTTLHITIDKQTKQAAGKLAKEMGLDISTLVKASLKTFVRTQSFAVEKAPRMTPYLENLIAEAEQSKKGDSPKFKDIKSAKKWLLSK